MGHAQWGTAGPVTLAEPLQPGPRSPGASVPLVSSQERTGWWHKAQGVGLFPSQALHSTLQPSRACGLPARPEGTLGSLLLTPMSCRRLEHSPAGCWWPLLCSLGAPGYQMPRHIGGWGQEGHQSACACGGGAWEGGLSRLVARGPQGLTEVYPRHQELWACADLESLLTSAAFSCTLAVVLAPIRFLGKQRE